MERVRAPPGAEDEAIAPAAEIPATPADASACVSCALPTTADICAHCGAARLAGDYRIVRVLAQSERGRVYEAVRADGQRVALKELVFSMVPGALQVEQFNREAGVLRQLEHPCIPRYIDAFQTGAGVHTRLFLAQQFVEGQSLLARLATHRFDEVQAKDLARQILRILDYLHGLSPRLIHRDLKPANLIMRPDGTVALVDFDTARDLRAQRTHGASLAGTFGYMPIEQLAGTVDATSDLHALGATLIHLLSRKAPHELLTSDMRLDFSNQVNLTPGFNQWLQRLVAREPGDRFQSVGRAQAALELSSERQFDKPMVRPVIAGSLSAQIAVTAVAPAVAHLPAPGRKRSGAFLFGRALGRMVRWLFKRRAR